MSENVEGYAGWALVEQMGFRKTVGRVQEVEQYGAKMLRLDVPVFHEGKVNGVTLMSVRRHKAATAERRRKSKIG
jgi:hypothetical protein